MRELGTWERLIAVAAIVVFLGAVAAVVNSGDDPGGGTTTGPDDFQLEAAPIDLAELLLPAAADGVVIIHVVAGLPSGCHSFDSYDLLLIDAVEGRVAVDIWNRIPVSDEPLACTAIYGMHDLVIEPPPELDGRVRTVVINGEVTLDLEDGPTRYTR